MSQTIRSPFGTVRIEDDSSLITSLLGDGERRTHRHEPVSMTPNVDIYEDSAGFTIWMDLPGVDKDSIQVSVSGNSLSVNAQTKKLNQEGGHWVRHERPVGSFVRSMHLGRTVDADSISANYADGTLKLRIDKKDQSESKTIQVSME